MTPLERPWHCACEASLTRLGTDYLDLYLLHFPVSNTQFPEVVAGFEVLL
jgi:diketogulonate reductase-like aldo/keto reductase